MFRYFHRVLFIRIICFANLIAGTDLGKITNPHEKVKFSKLQAMRSYRRRRGKEALLQRKSKHRRIQSTPDYTGPQQTRIELQCSHVQDGKQCEKPTLPIARFCGNRILCFKHFIHHDCCIFCQQMGEYAWGAQFMGTQNLRICRVLSNSVMQMYQIVFCLGKLTHWARYLEF